MKSRDVTRRHSLNEKLHYIFVSRAGDGRYFAC